MLYIMRGATGVFLQYHRILCLPRKIALIIEPRHVIYNVRNNRDYPPISPNIESVTKNDTHD